MRGAKVKLTGGVIVETATQTHVNFCPRVEPAAVDCVMDGIWYGQIDILNMQLA